MDFLKNLAGNLTGGGNQGDMLKNVTDQVSKMGGDQLAGHVNTMADNADPDTRAQLGQHLLDAFTNHASFNGTGADAAQAAGTSAEAVASGSPDAISSIVNYAKSNPQILQAAATAFMTRNPSALASLIPGLGGMFGGGQKPQQ